VKRELVFSFTAFLAGVVTIIIAPKLSYYFELLGLTPPSPMKAVGQEVYVTIDLASVLPTILLMILISILIAWSCAFIVRKQSK